MLRDIEGLIAELCSNVTHMVDSLGSDSTPRPIPLDRLRNWARESYQDIYREKALSIIRKLKLGEDLDPDEAKLAEEWMVGDLELYHRAEDHLEEWKKELRDICQRLSSLSHSGIGSDARSLLHIQAEVIEMDHLLRDVDRYRRTLDRVRRYRAFIGRDINVMAKEERVRLADLLRAMVYSDEM